VDVIGCCCEPVFAPKQNVFVSSVCSCFGVVGKNVSAVSDLCFVCVRVTPFLAVLDADVPGQSFE
jgi:hypothetical protein